MVEKKYKLGSRYTSTELMERAIQLMFDSIPEHTDRTDPKVGAVLAKEDGTLVNVSFRGELRQGDHAEFTLLERKHRTDNLDGYEFYTTLEPCAPGSRSLTKLSCAERIVNARIKKVYIGIEDPDPKVKGNGVAYLQSKDIEIEFFEQEFQKQITEANSQFLDEALERAKIAEKEDLTPKFNRLDSILNHFEYKDFSEEALERFREKLKISYGINTKDFSIILRKWSFLQYDSKTNSIYPTGLGILLFGRDPQIQYPQSMVKFSIQTDVTDNQKIIDFDGPLVLMPEKIEAYLEINFPKIVERSSFARKEIEEVYFEVLREMIINAIVHRDYTIEEANISVKIDDEKIVIESPGKPLVSIERLQDFMAPTFSVNPKIANVFYQMKYIEKRNMGMYELKECANLMGLNKPFIVFDDPYLKVTLWRKAAAKLDLSIEIILEFVESSGEVSTGDFAEKFGVSSRTALRHMNKLVEEGLLYREGEKKGTKYFLKD